MIVFEVAIGVMDAGQDPNAEKRTEAETDAGANEMSAFVGLQILQHSCMSLISQYTGLVLGVL